MDFSNATDLIFAKLVDWLNVAVAMVPNVVLGISILFSAFFLGRFLSRTAHRLAGAMTQNQSLVKLSSVSAFVTVMTIGFFITLAVLNLDQAVSSLLIGAGILILALSFAFQDIASNFISGFLLQLRPPFQIGDIIEVGNTVGTASALSVRATEIKTFDGTSVLIPNHQVFQSPLVNYTGIGKRRVVIRGSVSVESDLVIASRAATEAVASLGIRDPARDVEFFYRGFSVDGIIFEVSFWIDFKKYMDLQQGRSNAIIAIQQSFLAKDIAFAKMESQSR